MIFSIFLTDLRRSSISRSVAMFLALFGAAPSALGWAAARARAPRARMVDDMNWFSRARSDFASFNPPFPTLCDVTSDVMSQEIIKQADRLSSSDGRRTTF